MGANSHSTGISIMSDCKGKRPLYRWVSLYDNEPSVAPTLGDDEGCCLGSKKRPRTDESSSFCVESHSTPTTPSYDSLHVLVKTMPQVQVSSSATSELVCSTSECDATARNTVERAPRQRPMVITPQTSTVNLASQTATVSAEATKMQPSSNDTLTVLARNLPASTGTPSLRSGEAVSVCAASQSATSSIGGSRLRLAFLLILLVLGLSRAAIFRGTVRQQSFGGLVMTPQTNSTIGAFPADEDPLETVYVPGGGFSGFWFTLGRLKSIADPAKKSYFCFSAGCLGVVATLNNFNMEEMRDRAFSVQNMWKSGEIDRYRVVEKFVDSLLFDPIKGNISSTLPLSRLNIITSEPNGWFGGLKPSIRTPATISELREMLLQTTWIPLATGGGILYKGHMDGAFTILQHPICDHDVGLALDIDMYSNVVNVNLARSKVEKFWKAGLAKGL